MSVTDNVSEAKRRIVLEEKKHVSSKISDLSRYIGFGLVAVVYAVLTSDSKAVIRLYENHTSWLLLIAALGAITVILDYLQFLGGYLAVERALENKDGNYQYDDTSCWYILRRVAFWLKQLAAILGAIFLFAVIALSALYA